MVSPINVTINDGTSNPRMTTVQLSKTAPLSELRAVLQDQNIISNRDLFNKGDPVSTIPKDKEDSTPWTQAQSHADKSVHVGVDADKEFSAEDGLPWSQKKVILNKSWASGLGFGFDPSGDQGPRYTLQKVIQDLSVGEVQFTFNDTVNEDVVSTYSSRTSAYLDAGWLDANVAAKTPWVDISVGASFSKSSFESTSEKHVYVIGRYNVAAVTLFVKGFNTQLKPHPDFLQAIIAALAEDKVEKRTEAVEKVLKYYGTMFPSKVEMGGMKRLTFESKETSQITAESLKTSMSLKLGSIFGLADMGVDAGKISAETQKEIDQVSASHIQTVGGDIGANSLDEWRKSLSNPLTWSITRVLEVQSVLTLFEKHIQDQIAHLVLKAPLYMFTGSTTPKSPDGQPAPQPEPKHILVTNPDPTQIPFSSDFSWTNPQRLGTVLTGSLDGAVPLYYALNAEKQFAFTVDERDAFASAGYGQQGVFCFVYNTAKEGTVRLFRLLKTDVKDYIYATEENLPPLEKDGYAVEYQFKCYIYPASSDSS
ncbi:hypothetical protein FRB90_000405 [Tulasnella sp. 427]|nr:hypothetical protein FRB90_000405 [Tulasnella sp. 427]